MRDLLRGLGFAVVVLAVGCGIGSRKRAYRVNQDEGFLVIARHESHTTAITETSRQVTGHQVLTSGPGGAFTLKQPRSSVGSSSHTYVILSKPGYQLFAGLADQQDTGAGRFTVPAATSYAQELLAVTSFEEETERILGELTADQQRQVSAQLDARRAYLASTYPKEHAETERRLARHDFRRLPELAGTVLAASALPHGRLAVVVKTPRARALQIVDSKQARVAEVALADGGDWAALAREESGLAVVDGGAIRRFDLAGKPVATVTLDPPIAQADAANSLALLTDGYILGFDRTAAPCRIRRYGVDGRLIRERELPTMAGLSHVVLARSGAVVVHGTLVGNFEYGADVAGWKRDATNVAVLWLDDFGAEARVVTKGVETVAAEGGGFLAYASELYRPGEEEVRSLPGFQRQLLVRFSDDGHVLSTYEIVDESVAVATLKMGDPLEGRLVFFESGTGTEIRSTGTGTYLYELDLAALGRPY